jgi:hypothetical protein
MELAEHRTRSISCTALARQQAGATLHTVVPLLGIILRLSLYGTIIISLFFLLLEAGIAAGYGLDGRGV